MARLYLELQLFWLRYGGFIDFFCNLMGFCYYEYSGCLQIFHILFEISIVKGILSLRRRANALLNQRNRYWLGKQLRVSLDREVIKCCLIIRLICPSQIIMKLEILNNLLLKESVQMYWSLKPIFEINDKFLSSYTTIFAVFVFM